MIAAVNAVASAPEIEAANGTEVANEAGTAQTVGPVVDAPVLCPLTPQTQVQTTGFARMCGRVPQKRWRQQLYQYSDYVWRVSRECACVCAWNIGRMAFSAMP